MQKIVPGFWYNKNYSNIGYKIFSTEIYQEKRYQKRIEIIEKSYKRFLNLCTLKLNKFHNISWSYNEWEIVIGPWLSKYLSVILDRLIIIEEIISKKEKFYFLDSQKKKLNLNSESINHFTENCINDNWNEELFKRIYKFKTKKDKTCLFLKESLIMKVK